MKSKKVWIWAEAKSPFGNVDYIIKMNSRSKAKLYELDPTGNVDLVLKDSSGNILDKLKLNELYNKPK